MTIRHCLALHIEDGPNLATRVPRQPYGTLKIIMVGLDPSGISRMVVNETNGHRSIFLIAAIQFGRLVFNSYASLQTKEMKELDQSGTSSARNKVLSLLDEIISGVWFKAVVPHSRHIKVQVLSVSSTLTTPRNQNTDTLKPMSLHMLQHPLTTDQSLHLLHLSLVQSLTLRTLGWLKIHATPEVYQTIQGLLYSKMTRPTITGTALAIQTGSTKTIRAS